MKIAEENKEKRHLEEKICLNYRKFDKFTRENSLNENSNDTKKCAIQRYSIEDENQCENRRKKQRKKIFGRENLEELQQFNKRKFT